MNTIPLIEWFQTPAGLKHTLLRALPSELTGVLQARAADVGLLPVAEILRGYSDGILGGTGIACRGNADSVKVFCTGRLEDLRMIRADRGSRSSVALLKILLLEMYGIAPAFTEMIPAAEMVPAQGEGLLVIGDRCFELEKTIAENGRQDLRSWDLGQLWLDLTGLPFVFAARALAPGFLEEYGLAEEEMSGMLRFQELGIKHGVLPDMLFPRIL